ncbi:hypothetical protein [Halorussus marinus]|uniref:hypothetical protein n=1 Tax=Halorussus marinus TaxID=2505976 RepID=UPI00106E08F7|nr:hypothetical protein [Halorussus marinus]
MIDRQAIHDEIYRIREETDASREVRQSLQSIERSLSGMESDEEAPGASPDRLEEIRAQIDRLAADAEGETASELERLRAQVRDVEREERADDSEAGDER